MIAVIDYGAGNLMSVSKALDALECESRVTSDEADILAADKIILPGVGAFGEAIERLNGSGLSDVIRKAAGEGKPFLGICLGFQLLFDESDEAPGVSGLSLISGKVLRIPDAPGLKVPHMGWNSLNYPNEGRLFSQVDEESYVYFVHSYYVKAKERAVVTATTQYGVDIDASVEQGNIFGCQFHPEKSSRVGARILKNFLRL